MPRTPFEIPPDLVRRSVTTLEIMIQGLHSFFGGHPHKARIWGMLDCPWAVNDENNEIVVQSATYPAPLDTLKWSRQDLYRDPIRKEGLVYIVLDNHDDLTYLLLAEDKELKDPEEIIQAWDRAEED